MKRIAVLQSNFIPWKGYFDLIAKVDSFILYDDMQFTRRDWRNRNKIKTSKGAEWVTIPVSVKGKYFQAINQTVVSDPLWGKKIWKTIQFNYSASPYFEVLAPLLQDSFINPESIYLSNINRDLISKINSYLGISTEIRDSREFDLRGDKSERLLNLVRDAGGDSYVSGPAAKEYLDTGLFLEGGVEVEWFDYSGYECYPQLWGEFIHEVTILDLLFNCGPGSRDYLKM